MNDDAKSALIKGGLRTLCELAPCVGGAISNAWSEYETHRQNQRIEEFFQRFAERMKAIETEHGDLKERVAQLSDAPELLDRIADLVKREPVDQKRQRYVVALGAFVFSPAGTSHDERLSIIEAIESLTEQDLRFLEMFQQSEKLRGDMISGTTNAGWSTGGNDQALSQRYEVQLGPAIHSLAKLEGRGLLTPDELNAWFSSTGDSSAWYNQFRQKTWRITPMGKKMLQTIRSR
jgi:hypothetical protein